MLPNFYLGGKICLFYTHRKPKSSSGWDSSCHFKRPGMFIGCWWKDPLGTWWCAKRISQRTLYHKHLLLFLPLLHIHFLPINIFLQKIHPGWLRKSLVRAAHSGPFHHWKRMRSVFTVTSHCHAQMISSGQNIFKDAKVSDIDVQNNVIFLSFSYFSSYICATTSKFRGQISSFAKCCGAKQVPPDGTFSKMLECRWGTQGCRAGKEEFTALERRDLQFWKEGICSSELPCIM